MITLGIAMMVSAATAEKLVAAASEPPPRDTATLIVVQGLSGSAAYERQFETWTANWRRSADEMRAGFHLITSRANPTNAVTEATSSGTRFSAAVRVAGETEFPEHCDLLRLRQALEREPRAGTEPLYVVLIGHGTFDGRTARFNLDGPDLTPEQLHEWLQPFQRPVALIHCAACSGEFLRSLSQPGRIIVTATKSGSEHHFARFGAYLSEAVMDPDADLDQDHQISLFEAWLHAARRTREFYVADGRLETEHSLLDDDGNGQGSRMDWYQGTRPASAPVGLNPDGLRAHQLLVKPGDASSSLPPKERAERDRLEQRLIGLKQRKHELPASEYERQLEEVLVALAELYETAQTQR